MKRTKNGIEWSGPYVASRFLSAPLSYGGSDSYRSIDFLFVLTKMTEYFRSPYL